MARFGQTQSWWRVAPNEMARIGESYIAEDAISAGATAVYRATAATVDGGGGPDPYTPISYPSAAAAVAGLGLSTTANYVTWKPEWTSSGKMLEEIFLNYLALNDVLVLPERDEPYRWSTADGFRAGGVSAVQEMDGWRPIVSTYLGKPARTWFAMMRARRGILGLGPGAKLAPDDSTFTAPQQIPTRYDPNKSRESQLSRLMLNGQPSPGRYYRNADGSMGAEMVGCAEKILDFEHPNSIFANLTVLGRAYGAISYHFFGTSKEVTARRVRFLGAHRGHAGIPNGEACAMGSNGRYDWRGIYIDTRDQITGQYVGTSPFMVNRSPGGYGEDIYCERAHQGMITIWSSSGLHEFVRVTSQYNQGHGINLEQCGQAFELRWTGGKNLANDVGFHVGVNSEVGSAKITLTDVDLGQSGRLRNGVLQVQVYSYSGHAPLQLRKDIRHIMNGVDQPTNVYSAAG